MKKSYFLLHDNILKASDAGEISRSDCARLLLDSRSMWCPSHSANPDDWSDDEMVKHLESLGFEFCEFSRSEIANAYTTDCEGFLELRPGMTAPDFGVIEKYDSRTYYAVKAKFIDGWDCCRPYADSCVEAVWNWYGANYSPAYYYNWTPTARRAA